MTAIARQILYSQLMLPHKVGTLAQRISSVYLKHSDQYVHISVASLALLVRLTKFSISLELSYISLGLRHDLNTGEGGS